jgi:hypothetical protein
MGLVVSLIGRRPLWEQREGLSMHVATGEDRSLSIITPTSIPPLFYGVWGCLKLQR